jgi:hypothetical protein
VAYLHDILRLYQQLLLIAATKASGHGVAKPHLPLPFRHAF